MKSSMELRNNGKIQFEYGGPNALPPALCLESSESVIQAFFSSHSNCVRLLGDLISQIERHDNIASAIGLSRRRAPSIREKTIGDLSIEVEGGFSPSEPMVTLKIRTADKKQHTFGIGTRAQAKDFFEKLRDLFQFFLLDTLEPLEEPSPALVNAATSPAMEKAALDAHREWLGLTERELKAYVVQQSKTRLKPEHSFDKRKVLVYAEGPEEAFRLATAHGIQAKSLSAATKQEEARLLQPLVAFRAPIVQPLRGVVSPDRV